MPDIDVSPPLFNSSIKGLIREVVILYKIKGRVSF